jgi:Na+/H+ antiporter NhaB
VDSSVFSLRLCVRFFLNLWFCVFCAFLRLFPDSLRFVSSCLCVRFLFASIRGRYSRSAAFRGIEGDAKLSLARKVSIGR